METDSGMDVKDQVLMKEGRSEESPSEECKKDGDHSNPGEVNPETVVFKTPSFVIPSKNKVQNKQETAFAFKPPGMVPPKPATKGPSKEHDASQKENVQETDKDSVKSCDTSIENKQSEGLKPNKTAAPSPAEMLKQVSAAVPYKEPSWSSICKEKYTVEILKNGSIIDNIDLHTKAFYVIGRLPSCDIPMEHPSLSRHHAVLQYASGNCEDYPQGWYLYDLDSTHGTWINKNRVPPLKYHRIHVDFCLKFGGSTRLFILQGPDTDREEESELSVKEMVEQREKLKKEAEFLRLAEEEEAQRKVELLKKQEEARGCSWGINENEEVEEEDEESEINPFSVTENEDLYIDDPKKSLNGYFEREGLEPPEYEFTEVGFGKWKCSVELPLDTPSGEPMVAEVVQSGKRREAVIACALEACRILDRHGVLRQSKHESKKRKMKNWEEDDYYDSDEDVYLDRTGTIEKKREFRKNKAGKTDQKTDTYDTLIEKHKAIVAEMGEIEGKLEHAKAQAAAMDSDDVDALDAYMKAIKSGMMDSRTKMSLKRRLMDLKQEEQKVRKLVNIAKPATLPELKPTEQRSALASSGVIGSVGKMKGSLGTGKALRKPAVSVKTLKKERTVPRDEEFKEEVEEDEDDTEVKMETEVTVQNEVLLGNIDVKQERKTVERQVKTEIQAPRSQEKQKPKVKGPSLPLAAVLEKLQNESEVTGSDVSDEQNHEDSSKRTTNKTVKKLKGVNDGHKTQQVVTNQDPDDPEFASWIPPENQAGDGKTHLNAKYGY